MLDGKGRATLLGWWVTDEGEDGDLDAALTRVARSLIRAAAARVKARSEALSWRALARELRIPHKRIKRLADGLNLAESLGIQ